MSDEEARDQPANLVGLPTIGAVVRELLEAVSTRSRRGVGRARSQGRLTMERRQLERDRTAMLAKLGRESIALLNGGEVDHPGLRRGAARIAELDAQIAALEVSDAGADPEGDG